MSDLYTVGQKELLDGYHNPTTLPIFSTELVSDNLVVDKKRPRASSKFIL